MAEAGDTTTTSNRISWDEALTRAGSSEALLSWLREVPILAWHQGLYYSPSGKERSGPGKIEPDWWAQARVDPTNRRVIFLVPPLVRMFYADNLDPPAPLIMSVVFAFGIELERGAVEARFPVQPKPPEQERVEHVSGAGAWIAAEVKRMKEAGEIPPNIKKTDLARDLESRMRKAAASDKSLRPITWSSIKNRLPEWGLWPVTSIK